MTDAAKPELLAHAPAELTAGRLRRLGEGIGRVVYASDRWVVKRERSPSEIVALIVLWKILRRIERLLPRWLGSRLVQRPARQIQMLRVLAEAIMAVVPKALWFTTHIRHVWRIYHFRNTRGEALAREHLEGTALVPLRIEFPPTCVKIGGWPGELTVCEATERVEATLDQRIAELADAERFDDLEALLERFLRARQAGWSQGVFSVDAHLKNYGIIGSRIVLLDAGGLTDRWPDVERRLAAEEDVDRPHVALGIGPALKTRPDIAERFDARWKEVVNPEVVAQTLRRA